MNLIARMRYRRCSVELAYGWPRDFTLIPTEAENFRSGKDGY